MTDYNSKLTAEAAREYIAARFEGEALGLAEVIEARGLNDRVTFNARLGDKIAAYIGAYSPYFIDLAPNYIAEGLNMLISAEIGEAVEFIAWPEIKEIANIYRGNNRPNKGRRVMPGALKISRGNSKINALSDYTGLVTAALDLTAGVTCPAADICRGHIEGGKIVRGPRSTVLCYAVKLEAAWPSVYRAHKHNEDILRAAVKSGQAADLLYNALEGIDILRLHASGDLFNLGYAEALAEAASRRPNTLIFGYTKFAPALKIAWPNNVILQYSIGGVYDSKIDPVLTPSNFIVMPGDITYNIGDLKRAIVKHNGRLYSIPVQVSKFDDFNFILARSTFGITLH